MAREINLVPDIKGEMIRTLKLRNLTIFICIVVASASIAVVLVFGIIAGSQQAAIESKKNTLDSLSDKINSYSDLNNFLTIKDQLENLSIISDNKKLLSRTFGILSALMPKNEDTIIISELSVDLSGEIPNISFDAQANSGKEPFIDYAVLVSFKKSMDYMRYDYGDYVDKNDNTIPAYCIIETGADGAMLNDREKGYYAYWLINGEGCNPLSDAENSDDEYLLEDYDGQQVVRIWRTPQFDDWFATNNMNKDGSISGVAHFRSKCITYVGITESNGTTSWTSNNDSCMLVPNGSNGGIIITGSSNGRDTNDELVLRFSATINITPEFYTFNNHHVLAIGPAGRYNVTDSYVQIQNMFGEKAKDCAEGDTACLNNTYENGEE